MYTANRVILFQRCLGKRNFITTRGRNESLYYAISSVHQPRLAIEWGYNARAIRKAATFCGRLRGLEPTSREATRPGVFLDAHARVKRPTADPGREVASCLGPICGRCGHGYEHGSSEPQWGSFVTRNRISLKCTFGRLRSRIYYMMNKTSEFTAIHSMEQTRNGRGNRGNREKPRLLWDTVAAEPGD